MKSTSWFRVAIATSSRDPELVLASGEHLGEAIQKAEKNLDGWVIAVDPATTEEIPLGESVGKGQIVKLGPAPAGLATFKFPVGIVPATSGGITNPQRGWVERTGEQLAVIEAQTDRERVIDLFLSIVERLPSADNLEVRMLPSFDAGATTDVWLTSRVNAKKIIRLLDDHDTELFGNGWLELGVYVRAHKGTLRLTSNKTIAWIAEERGLVTEVTRWFGELDVPPIANLVTVDEGAHHRYRPAGTRNRSKLGDELYRQRLRRVDQIKVS
ncbi:MAG: hypothetical protein QM831_05250 [Kofleriaceae bacterium]